MAHARKTVPRRGTDPHHTKRQVKSELIDLTPILASRLLADSEKFLNRKVSPAAVRRIASAITRNEWQLNGESLVLDEKGLLLDGQHRCAAVVAAGKTVQTFIVKGVDRRSFATIDTGRLRTLSDVLHTEGKTETNLLATVARDVHRLAQGCMTNWKAGGDDAWASNLALARFVATNPSIEEAISQTPRKDELGTISGLVLGRWLCNAWDPEAAVGYFEQVINGLNLTEGEPGHTARQRLLTLRTRALTDMAKGRAKLGTPRSVIAFVLARGFAHEVNCELTSRISMPKGQLDDDAFRRLLPQRVYDSIRQGGK